MCQVTLCLTVDHDAKCGETGEGRLHQRHMNSMLAKHTHTHARVRAHTHTHTRARERMRAHAKPRAGA